MNKILSRPYVIVLALYSVVGIAILTYLKHGLGITYGSKEFVNSISIPTILIAITLACYCYYRRNVDQLPNPNRPLGWKLVLLPAIPTVALASYAIYSQAAWSKSFFIPLLTMLAAGITEELMFRKIIVTSLLKEVTPAKAIIISATIFAALHALNSIGGQPLKSTLLQLVMTFLGGTAYAMFYMYTKSISLVIVMHWLWDYVVVSGVYTLDSSLSMVLTLVPLLEVVAILAIAFKHKEILTPEYLTK